MIMIAKGQAVDIWQTIDPLHPAMTVCSATSTAVKL